MIIKQLTIKKPITELDEITEKKIMELCLEKGVTFIEARDKVCARRKIAA